MHCLQTLLVSDGFFTVFDSFHMVCGTILILHSRDLLNSLYVGNMWCYCHLSLTDFLMPISIPMMCIQWLVSALFAEIFTKYYMSFNRENDHV